jgi:hypothetical protein
MSREEWRCGGNSGRLLLNLFPAETSFYIHGVRRDADRLRAALLDGSGGSGGGASGPACVLFPGSGALTVPQWLASASAPWGCNSRSGNAEPSLRTKDFGADDSGSHADSSHARSNSSASSSGPGQTKSVVLVDGTWRQARRMAKHLAAVLLPGVPQVTLTLEGPSRLSVFRRKQSAEGRVCTSEALSLFLGEVVVASAARAERTTSLLSTNTSPLVAEACYVMVQRAVQLNNAALEPTRTLLWVGSGGAPDW